MALLSWYHHSSILGIMVSREPASVIMAHVRKQGVVSRVPTSVIMVHVR